MLSFTVTKKHEENKMQNNTTNIIVNVNEIPVIIKCLLLNITSRITPNNNSRCSLKMILTDAKLRGL